MENKEIMNQPQNVMELENLPKELFKKSKVDTETLHDQAFETKPVSFLKGAFMRFAKNKASIVAAVIIAVIILYAIIVPFASPKAHVSATEYPGGFSDRNFSYVLPYNPIFKGTGFWDGTEVVEGYSEQAVSLLQNDDSNHNKLVEVISSKVDEVTPSYKITTYKIRIDSYAVGNKVITIDESAYNNLVSYEKEQGIYHVLSGDKKSIMKPLIDVATYITQYKDIMAQDLSNCNYSELGKTSDQIAIKTKIDNVTDAMNNYYNQNANIYYQLSAKKNGEYVQNGFITVKDTDGNLVPIYKVDSEGNYVYANISNGMAQIRVDYFDYFVYHNGFQPYYLFGANDSGQDLFLRLATGARFSLLLGVGISLINILIGVIWGSISGYYGGKVDLIMERFTDIISAIPSVIILTICSIQFTDNASLKSAIGDAGIMILAFLVAFVYSGWVGVAGTTRMQFYRFKGQEYVLASRTLGAKDRRLIFKHILPNAIGTLVTSSVLMIPSVIFSESSLSYLGIINFTTSGISSIGSLLEEGQTAGLSSHPHLLLFPCIIISLLMICFNLFGNGLRDAFNTSLKGSEE